METLCLMVDLLFRTSFTCPRGAVSFFLLNASVDPLAVSVRVAVADSLAAVATPAIPATPRAAVTVRARAAVRALRTATQYLLVSWTRRSRRRNSYPPAPRSSRREGAGQLLGGGDR